MRSKSLSLRAWFLGSMALLLVSAGVYSGDQTAKTPPPQGKKERPAGEPLSTVTYDVGDILAKRSFWDLDQVLSLRPTNLGRRNDTGEGLTRSLLEYLIAENPELARRFLGKNARYQILLLNRKQLVVRADRKTHAQINDMVTAFRRLLDVAIVVETRLFEVDREVYDKQIVGKLPRHPGSPPVFGYPATAETEQKFLDGKLAVKPVFEGMKPLKQNKVIIQDREHGVFFSWRTAVPYERNPARVFEKKELAVAYPGFSVSMSPVVSSDRRQTRIKLTQKVTQLVEWQRIKAHQLQTHQGTKKAEQLRPDPDTKEVTFEVPVLQEYSFTSTFAAFDGWPVVVPILWQPGDQGKDRALVLVFSARILIEEEERQIQKGLEELKKKP